MSRRLRWKCTGRVHNFRGNRRCARRAADLCGPCGDRRNNMPLIAPNMPNLRRTFAKNPQPPALWNPSASTIEEAQNGLRLRLPSSEVQIATAHIQTAANVST
jgi:hypothetical protein